MHLVDRLIHLSNRSISVHLYLVVQIPHVFIRAPVVTKILNQKDSLKRRGNKIKQLIPESSTRQSIIFIENYDGKDHELIVAVQQGHILGTSFHPELAEDYRFHKWFLDEFVIKKLKQYIDRII